VIVLGDAAASLKFSHGAELQATTIIGNFFSPLKKKINYDHFSWVTFTDPEIATFGLSERELQKRGIKYQKLTHDFSDDDRAVTSDYTYGLLILLVKPGWFGFSDARILGGTMVAPLAGEMFQELVLARSEGLGIKSIFNKIYAYPTASRVTKTMVLNYYLKALKPWMTKLMKLFY
jgi:pyruvate/2-oxoglutarate dehydrogenase complex dihydrolipoamide dehydrogenase (E3) component